MLPCYRRTERREQSIVEALCPSLSFSGTSRAASGMKRSSKHPAANAASSPRASYNDQRLSPLYRRDRGSASKGECMTPRFTRSFKVRHYELDAFGQVNGVNLVRYMQEAAIEASTALGFSPDWYNQHGVGWVVRRLSVRYFAPALYGDEVTAATWLSGLRGVRSIREYDLTRSRDGQRVARGRAEWVYMDSQTGQPTRIPDAWADAFTMKDKPEDLGVRLANPRPTESAHRYSSSCRVRFDEVDT